MKQLCTCIALVLLASGAFGADHPATLDNDDSCDVIVTPAATLLLPYFEVDLTRANGETTLFTITNVTQVPRIARVTLWTDWSFPVITFNVFLTGYDVQAINLFDVISRGKLAEPGTSPESDVGRRSLDNDENPLLDINDYCLRLPTVIPRPILDDVQTALVTGRTANCKEQRVGGQHVNAVGYVTIDDVRSCTYEMPTDPAYSAGELLFDNVLTGDYEQVNSSENFAQGGPLVHIRAIPEGGAPGALTTNFGRTFYSNFQGGRTADRRQPLPSTFAARWISGGDTHFATSFKIWREGLPRPDASCAMSPNGSLGIADLVRFDEQENPVAFDDCQICVPTGPPVLPPSSRMAESNSLVFPPNPDASVAGWMYMNLDRLDGFPKPPTANQSWVVVSMAASGRYSADFDAASLDNGCSFPTAVTDLDGGEPAIAPAPNGAIAAFPSGSPRTIDNDDSCDIKVTPAATLLLPYFEVDLLSREGQTTLFTVTNVSREPQIARVTVWTDWAFPVLSFNLFLTGYDVQAINLYDVLALGRIAEPGTSSRSAVGRRSGDNDANPLLDLSSCGNLVSRLSETVLRDLQTALTTGRTTSCGTKGVGGVHSNAIGYLTIDLVQNCGTRLPTDAGYFASDLLFDNVLIGDYQEVASAQNFSKGNAMVHIRAIPEGGLPGSAITGFRRTFYSRLQAGGTVDRRQPLPSTFAARWIAGGSSGFRTDFKIWREGVTGSSAGCSVSANATVDLPDIVRFDEEENPTTYQFDCPILCPVPFIGTPVAGRFGSSHSLFPDNPNGAVAGWMYFNLDHQPIGSSPPYEFAQQNWVIVSMAAEGRYSVDFDATALGNGCSPPAEITDDDGDAPAIGPAPNANPGL